MSIIVDIDARVVLMLLHVLVSVFGSQWTDHHADGLISGCNLSLRQARLLDLVSPKTRTICGACAGVAAFLMGLAGGHDP